jgi:hemoglobin/transferrin/lactoferrin receptor protein
MEFTMRRTQSILFLLSVAAPVLMGPATGEAQEKEAPARTERDSATVSDTLPKKTYTLPTINVTATRRAKDIFSTPVPVSVVDSTFIREKIPNTGADLLRDIPGLDVNGVGANQTRPIIRGQRGQRILLLEDGTRMNNSRRQQDFGELPAIVNINDVQQVEVVRGPASVLYGSDAIGGVINLRTNDVPPLLNGDVIGGRVMYNFRSEGSMDRPSGDFFGRVSKFSWRVAGGLRYTQPYTAPAGSFGDLTLQNDAVVQGSGVDDGNINALLAFDLNSSHQLFGRVAAYWADRAGFGYVDNADLGLVDAPVIDINYPEQRVNKLTLGYRAKDVDWLVLDRLDVTGYRIDNERQLDLDIFIPFGEGTPPGAGLVSQSQNYTDLETLGFRIEAAKLLTPDIVLTYGADYFHDDSRNTDHSTTGVIGFGPPDFEESDVPSVPNATYQGFGAFAQGDFTLIDRMTLIVGGRYQSIRANTRETANLDLPPSEHSDKTFVGAANLLIEVVPSLNVIATVGRAFRAPNLVELFFDGATPEGSGYQLRNPDLVAEKSLNMDLGLKFRLGRVGAEAYVFRNKITDGITIAATGEEIGPFPVFQNVNIDNLLYRGVELHADYEPVNGFIVSGSYTYLDGENQDEPATGLGDSYSSRVQANLTYRSPGGRWWSTFNLRHNGERKDVDLGVSPIGPVLPSFTVLDLRGGVTLFTLGPSTNYLGISIENLTNELYAEFSNASFFRPEPRRTLLISWITAF